MGRILLVDFCRVNFSGKHHVESLYPETKYKLFVGHLSWTVTSESLAEAFQQHGTVVGARVIYNGETGQSRGFGFVCYANRSEMEAALTLMNDVVCYLSSIHSFMHNVYIKTIIATVIMIYNFGYTFVFAKKGVMVLLIVSV